MEFRLAEAKRSVLENKLAESKVASTTKTEGENKKERAPIMYPPTRKGTKEEKNMKKINFGGPSSSYFAEGQDTSSSQVKRKEATGGGDSAAPFMPSDTFKGRWAGYVFRLGANGTCGYYKTPCYLQAPCVVDPPVHLPLLYSPLLYPII